MEMHFYRFFPLPYLLLQITSISSIAYLSFSFQQNIAYSVAEW